MLESGGHEAELDPLAAGLEGAEDTLIRHVIYSDADFWGIKKRGSGPRLFGISTYPLYQFRGVNWDMEAKFIFTARLVS